MRFGVTINGMLQYDPQLFSGLVLPSGLQLQTFVDTVCFSYGDLYLTNADPAWTRAAITLWGQRHKYYLDELYKTLSYEYNPIENYDRYEEYTDTTEGETADTISTSHNDTVNTSHDDTVNTTHQESGSNSRTTESETSGTMSNTASTAHNVAAYNAATLQPDSSGSDTSSGTTAGTGEETVTGTDSASGTGSETASGTGSETAAGTGSEERTGTESRTMTHSAHIHGNIGVTTAAQMIQGQRDIIKISWYDEAAKLFASEFCIMLY